MLDAVPYSSVNNLVVLEICPFAGTINEIILVPLLKRDKSYIYIILIALLEMIKDKKDAVNFQFKALFTQFSPIFITDIPIHTICIRE